MRKSVLWAYMTCGFYVSVRTTFLPQVVYQNRNIFLTVFFTITANHLMHISYFYDTSYVNYISLIEISTLFISLLNPFRYRFKVGLQHMSCKNRCTKINCFITLLLQSSARGHRFYSSDNSLNCSWVTGNMFMLLCQIWSISHCTHVC